MHLFVQNYFKKSSKKPSTHEECVGWKLLKYRAENDDNEVAKNIKSIKRQLLVAFHNANKEYRADYETTKNNNLSRKNNNATEPILPQINNNIENNDENVNENINCESLKNKLTKTMNKKRYTCCAKNCGVTSTNSPHLTFSRVPGCQENKITDQSTNNVRQTYYRKSFTRKEWLKRLGLPSNNKNNHLLFCSNHVIEIQDTEYSWKNSLNIVQLTTEKIRLPKKDSDPPILTREQHNKRQVLSIDKRSDKKQKVSQINTLNILQDITNTCPVNNKNTMHQDDNLNILPNDNIHILTDNNRCIVPSKKIIRKYCCYINCRINDSNKYTGIKFHCVPKHPPDLNEKASNYQRLQHAKRIYYQKLFCKCIGLNVKDKRKDLRICNKHKIISVTKILSWYDKNNNKQSTKVIFDLPAEPSSIENKETRKPKGLGIDRYICNTINIAKQNMNIPGREDLGWALSTQQLMALNDEPDLVHTSVAQAVGINVHQHDDNIKYKILNEKKRKAKRKKPSCIRSTYR